MKTLNKKELRRIISEELTRKSEMTEFGRSRSGKKVVQAGGKISSAAQVIAEVSMDQTGNMARTLESLSEFVGRIGETLSSLGTLQEGESATDRMPTVSELKAVTKAIQKLEKA